MDVSEHETEEPSPKLAPLRVNPATKYRDHPGIIKQQHIECWALVLSLLVAVVLTFYLWQFSEAWWSWLVLAGLAGTIGGLLHSLKWFYRAIGRGEWEWDRTWWRFLNPLVSGVLGFSIYVVFRSGVEATQSTSPGLPGREGYYAYSIGFLTGLFADNAMSKLRDIAYVLFGETKPADSKPKDVKSPSNE